MSRLIPLDVTLAKEAGQLVAAILNLPDMDNQERVILASMIVVQLAAQGLSLPEIARANMLAVQIAAAMDERAEQRGAFGEPPS